jgi:hypothetical protein
VQNYLQDDHLARFLVTEAMGLVKRGTISLDGTKSLSLHAGKARENTFAL